jgi:uncharacterized protein YktB (UPF0637 family)
LLSSCSIYYFSFVTKYRCDIIHYLKQHNQKQLEKRQKTIRKLTAPTFDQSTEHMNENTATHTNNEQIKQNVENQPVVNSTPLTRTQKCNRKYKIHIVCSFYFYSFILFI